MQFAWIAIKMPLGQRTLGSAMENPARRIPTRSRSPVNRFLIIFWFADQFGFRLHSVKFTGLIAFSAIMTEAVDLIATLFTASYRCSILSIVCLLSASLLPRQNSPLSSLFCLLSFRFRRILGFATDFFSPLWLIYWFPGLILCRNEQHTKGAL